MSSQLKHIVKLNGGDFNLVKAQVSTTQDLLRNIPLLNSLFEFPESNEERNNRFFSSLSVHQYYDETLEDNGMSRRDFIRHYTQHPTLLEELQHNNGNYLRVFDSSEEAQKWVISATGKI